MGVHVDEIHTDVLASRSGGADGTARPAPGHLAEQEETWAAARRRADLLARRTCAEAFDD